MAKKKELGKGLSEILSGSWEEITDIRRIEMLSLDDIVPAESQARVEFDKDALQDLANSIMEQGVLEPILVRPLEKGFQLIAGERRWRASGLAGKKDIPAIILDVKDPSQLALIGLVENLQREDLNPVEEAVAFNDLSENYNMTQEEISKSVGKSRSVVANTMRILSLPSKIVDMVRNGRLSSGHTRVLLSVEDSIKQLRLATLAVTRGLSVERLSILAESDTKEGRKKRVIKKNDPKLLAIQEQLQETLATKVEITQAKKKIRLSIELYSEEELLKFVAILAKGTQES